MAIDRSDPAFGVVARTTPTAERVSPLEQEIVLLFDQWRDPLLAYVVKLGLPVHEGEEIVQEVFLALFRHLVQGKSRENLRGWIFRVGHNLALKRRYAAGRQLLQSSAENAFEIAQDRAPDPEQGLAMRQRQARLLAVVEALPEQDRYCLHLRAEGLRYREIADVLGISLGGVALSLGRSLERLRRADR